MPPAFVRLLPFPTFAADRAADSGSRRHAELSESRDHLVHHVSVHVGQPHVSAAEAESAFGMIDPQQMQHRGVQIMNLKSIFHRSVSPLVGCADRHARFGSAAGHPDREPERIVVPAIRALGERRAAELASPDDQCRIEQAGSLQVFDQRRDRLIDSPTILVVTVDQAGMLIPAVAVARLGRSAR